MKAEAAVDPLEAELVPTKSVNNSRPTSVTGHVTVTLTNLGPTRTTGANDNLPAGGHCSVSAIPTRARLINLSGMSTSAPFRRVGLRLTITAPWTVQTHSLTGGNHVGRPAGPELQNNQGLRPSSPNSPTWRS